MWWIIAIVVFVICFFLWLVVRSASHSIDDETQSMLDEEQTRIVEEYLQKKAEQQAEKKTK